MLRWPATAKIQHNFREKRPSPTHPLTRSLSALSHTFQAVVVVQIQHPQLGHVQVAHRQGPIKALSPPVDLLDRPPGALGHDAVHDVALVPDALGKGTERLHLRRPFPVAPRLPFIPVLPGGTSLCRRQ